VPPVENAVVDHLVYATPDLAATVADLDRRFGLSLEPGGRHLGLGTRNYLADLGDGAFLEVIGPDLDQPDPEQPRPFGVDYLTEPRLLTWAARVTDLDAAVRQAEEAGYDQLGSIMTMTRDGPDGAPITWRLAVPQDGREWAGLVPFLIDWGDSPHPSKTATPGLRMVSFTGWFADVPRVRARLTMLGVRLDVEERAEPGLSCVLATPAGEVTL
jgi:hypothetical protein